MGAERIASATSDSNNLLAFTDRLGWYTLCQNKVHFRRIPAGMLYSSPAIHCWVSQGNDFQSRQGLFKVSPPGSSTNAS